MTMLKTFAYGVLAGVCIAIGGTAFLSLDNKVLGALFFTVGLFAICTVGFNLFTGKVCYVFERDKRYALDLIWIWLGNLCGTWLTAQAEHFTRIGDAITAKAAVLCEAKLNDGLLSIFILAILCNILMFIAVDSFSKNPHEIGKYLALFFGVMLFILCGFEHCVANMYYFSVADMWSWKTLLHMLVMSLGNAAGGVIIPLIRMWKESTKRTKERIIDEDRPVSDKDLPAKTPALGE